VILLRRFGVIDTGPPWCSSGSNMVSESNTTAVLIGGLCGRARTGFAPVEATPESGRPTEPSAGTAVYLAALADASWSVDGDAARGIRFAVDTAPALPPIGAGRTLDLFDALATVAAADLTAARVLEAHIDALAILAQDRSDAGVASADQATPAAGEHGWGVFAAEGPGQRVTATLGPTGWRLDGRKPWCSLAGSLDRALVTAHTTAEGDTPAHRRLFSVDLSSPGITVQEDAWVATGLSQVTSGPVDFLSAPAAPVGADDWYLSRPGFSWGGIQVAACWFGGAVAVARRLRAAASAREPDQIMLAHLGAIDLALVAAGAALADAAIAIDRGDAVGPAGTLLAARVRGLVARAVEEVLTRTGHALGPAPLALDARHSRRVADLTLYVRQHHAERDDAALGARLLGAENASW
jgi:alkylation response protein AidB-like acyl-CoA dehydrogenase